MCRIHSECRERHGRCVAAHHNTFVATEHDSCADIVNSLRLHVRALMSKIKDYWNRSLAIGLVRDFVENRATSMALRQVLDAALKTEELPDHIWIWGNITGQERQACLNILDDLLSQVTAQSNVLRSDLKACNE